jgi:hypothetical protein
MEIETQPQTNLDATAPVPAGPNGNESSAAPLPESAAVPDEKAAPARPQRRRLLRTSARKLAANRANARKATGPRTEEGKKRAAQNGFTQGLERRSVRLLGLAEARTLRQDPGAAERLYEQLIAPYQPAPAILAMHFQDLARLHMELEAWERIRDAQLEHRWQQSDLERRRRYHQMERDLAATAKDLLERGLCRLDDSPAKFKKQADCFLVLKEHLRRRDFNVGHLLEALWGKDLEPDRDRAQTICIRCQKLMTAEGSGARKKDLDSLASLVDEEYRDAMASWALKLDENTMTRFACLAGLGVTTLEDQRMRREGQSLRQAIDREQRVINSVLRTLGLSKEADGVAGDLTVRATL